MTLMRKEQGHLFQNERGSCRKENGHHSDFNDAFIRGEKKHLRKEDRWGS